MEANSAFGDKEFVANPEIKEVPHEDEVADVGRFFFKEVDEVFFACFSFFRMGEVCVPYKKACLFVGDA